LSSQRNLEAGLRQGSVLPPIVFAVYVNDISLRFEESKLGCNVKLLSVNVFMYADDLLLVASTIKNLLQLMIDICIE